MFSKISRYRKLSDIVATDSKGRKLASKNLRTLPAVSGTFLHTVEGVDRLDHLAYKYYKQPRKWWRICDANPTFMSPQALLGNEPIVTYQFPLAFDDEAGGPPWGQLRRQLSQVVGVESLHIREAEAELVQRQREVEGESVTVLVPRYERTVIVTYNELNVSAGDLMNIMMGVGFEVGQPAPVGRVGKQIVIPPNLVG